MADKNKQYIPKPGLPEAIHPEIGNGASWAEDAHAFLLRTPDPAIQLAGLLIPDEIPVTAPSDTKDTIEIHTSVTPAEAPTSTTTPDTPDVQDNPNVAEIIITADQPTTSGPIKEHGSKDSEDTVIPKGKKKKKTGKGGNGAKDDIASDLIGETLEDNPAKAGKLVRKAAKSLQRQEEVRNQEAKPEKIAPEQALSPYTSWLKSLTGSEYVHPYEDDFAFAQATDPSKEGISETFADLLAAQGYKEQAMEMYIKLIEKYPEKSGFFAAKIEALQQ
jgi:hypothetical protein